MCFLLCSFCLYWIVTTVLCVQILWLPWGYKYPPFYILQFPWFPSTRLRVSCESPSSCRHFASLYARLYMPIRDHLCISVPRYCVPPYPYAPLHWSTRIRVYPHASASLRASPRHTYILGNFPGHPLQCMSIHDHLCLSVPRFCVPPCPYVPLDSSAPIRAHAWPSLCAYLCMLSPCMLLCVFACFATVCVVCIFCIVRIIFM
jgi:hypothetical protein